MRVCSGPTEISVQIFMPLRKKCPCILQHASFTNVSKLFSLGLYLPKCQWTVLIIRMAGNAVLPPKCQVLMSSFHIMRARTHTRARARPRIEFSFHLWYTVPSDEMPQREMWNDCVFASDLGTLLGPLLLGSSPYYTSPLRHRLHYSSILSVSHTL